MRNAHATPSLTIPLAPLAAPSLLPNHCKGSALAMEYVGEVLILYMNPYARNKPGTLETMRPLAMLPISYSIMPTKVAQQTPIIFPMLMAGMLRAKPAEPMKDSGLGGVYFKLIFSRASWGNLSRHWSDTFG